MFTTMFQLVLTNTLLVAPTCGDGEAVIKTIKKDPKQKTAKQLVLETHDQALTDRNDETDRSYSKTYTTASENKKLAFEILKE